MESRFDRRELLFQPRGIPPLGTSLSLALQHLVAMIVGCVTPPIIIAGAIGLSQEEQVLLIQASLVMSAVSTLLQLFPIGRYFGSGLPVILGVSFAYVPSMQAIAASGGGIGAIAGAMLVGGVVAILVGLFVRKIRLLFPPVITGTERNGWTVTLNWENGIDCPKASASDQVFVGYFYDTLRRSPCLLRDIPARRGDESVTIEIPSGDQSEGTPLHLYLFFGDSELARFSPSEYTQV